MLKKYIKTLSNPLLYYADKEGHSVFRNYSLLFHTGNSYNTEIAKANVGKALEYRFQLDKYLKLAYFLITLVLYLIFIHIKYSIWGLLFFEILWVVMIMGARLLCSYQYHNFLISHFGKYEVIEFAPPVSKRKTEEFVALFRSKIIVLFICIALFLSPTILLKLGIKCCLTSKFNGYKHAITLSNVYNAIYPKSAKVYDMRAVAHYMQRDYDKALEDYKIALDLSGRKFTKHDLVRFENLLLIQKRVASSQDAVDIFNEYITKKKMSVLEESQMLWVKSIFKIENSIINSILQDYDDLLASLDEKDIRNQFYISSDRAYMLYLMQQYEQAIISYNSLISFAEENQKLFSENIPALYAERGWAKKRLGDNVGASIDFKTSQIPPEQLKSYEPAYANQEFVRDKF